MLLDGNKKKSLVLILLPDGNIFLVFKFHEETNLISALYFKSIIDNIIMLIHDDK